MQREEATTIKRGQDRVKTLEALIDRKTNLDGKHAEERAIDEGFWAFVKPCKNEVEQSAKDHELTLTKLRQKYISHIIQAGEYLEQRGCPQERIFRRLAKEFDFLYGKTQLWEVVHNTGKDQWFRSYEKDKKRISEIEESLTKNIVILSLRRAQEATVMLSGVYKKAIEALYDVTLNNTVRTEILEGIQNEFPEALEQMNHASEVIKTHAQQGKKEFDAREDLPLLAKVTGLAKLCAESIRTVSRKFEKSTKWWSKMFKKDTQLEEAFCPNCYTDILPTVGQIVRDQTGELHAHYIEECKKHGAKTIE